MPDNKTDKKNEKKSRVNFVTLGCPKNMVDSEKISASLPQHKFEIFHNSDKKSDIVVINTCGFINDAKEESVDTILHYIDLKQKNNFKIFVTGCLAQRYKNDLLREIPLIDGVFGLNETRLLLKEISKKNCELTGHRFLSTPPHYAYLKISEGCDRKCSFCAIPSIRGANISYPMERILEEAEMLAEKNVKELIIIAQDTTYYGLDIYKKRSLAKLLEKLSDINQFEWIRLHYAFPAGFPEDVLDVMQSRNNICKYIDIPLQHANDEILLSMRRGIDKKGTIGLLKKIRNKVPGVALRTAFIVGYPAETRAQFTELNDFIREQQFERLGVFAYSPEDGTEAAQFEGSISSKVKKQRMEDLMSLQQEISLAHNKKLVGKTLKVIIDRREGDFFVGRTEYDSPEIDNEVLIPLAKAQMKAGSFYTVKITRADVYDLYAE